MCWWSTNLPTCEPEINEIDFVRIIEAKEEVLRFDIFMYITMEMDIFEYIRHAYCHSQSRFQRHFPVIQTENCLKVRLLARLEQLRHYEHF